MHKTLNTKTKLLSHVYDSVYEIENAEILNIHNANYLKQSLQHTGTDWWGKGLKDINAVKKAIEEGWPTGYEFLDKMPEFSLGNLTSIKRKRVRRDFGDEVDPHSILRGELDTAWTGTTKKMTRGNNSIVMVVDIGANGGVSAESLVWKGAVAVALARKLQQSGRAIKIALIDRTIGSSNDNNHNAFVVSVTVKDYNTPLDVERLLSSCAMAGFFRYLFFKGIALLREDINYGFGRVSRDPKHLPHYPGVHDMLLVPSTDEIYDEETAKRWLINASQQFTL